MTYCTLLFPARTKTHIHACPHINCGLHYAHCLSWPVSLSLCVCASARTDHRSDRLGSVMLQTVCVYAEFFESSVTRVLCEALLLLWVCCLQSSWKEIFSLRRTNNKQAIYNCFCFFRMCDFRVKSQFDRKTLWGHHFGSWSLNRKPPCVRLLSRLRSLKYPLANQSVREFLWGKSGLFFSSVFQRR